MAAERDDSGGPAPHWQASLDAIAARLDGRRLAVFLDYDGTLTPIADRPDLAVLPAETRQVLRGLAAASPVAIVSGRGRADVEALVGLGGLAYAGCHGLDIALPEGGTSVYREGADHAPAVEAATGELTRRLAGIAGALVEPKGLAVAVHDRLAADSDRPRIAAIVHDVAARHPGLRVMEGKRVHELRPDIAWDKGKAVLWVLSALGLDGPDVLPVYLGDDVTDRDAFRALRGRGVSVYIGPPEGADGADYRLDDPGEVRGFLAGLARVAAGKRT